MDAGLHQNAHIILYANEDREVYRAFFVLHYFGFYRLSVLAGGLTEWLEERFPADLRYHK